MSHNCPICNAAGLPDYTKQHVICHQCNSVLKSFLSFRLHFIAQKRRYEIVALVGLPLLAILFLGLFH
jgi:hypothetical protein